MSEPQRPLALWPYPVAPEHLALVKRAKAELDLPYLVAPVPAVPGGPVRVLALGSLPPFLCEAALVRDPSRYESILAAVRHVLTAPAGAPGTFTEDDYLDALLPGARDITHLLPVDFDGNIDMKGPVAA